jgi:hypothetical protein
LLILLVAISQWDLSRIKRKKGEIPIRSLDLVADELSFLCDLLAIIGK